MINTIKLNGTSIYLGNKSLIYLTDFIENLCPTKIFILLDKNSKKYCLPILLMAVPTLKNAHFIELANGESAKTIHNVQLVCKSLLIHEVDRKSLIINLGGGVVCDLGGFTASIIKRGIQFINIPTTLMSQVDAAIGGKVAVNFDNYKNQIGLFSNPAAIFIHFPFNDSLPHLHLLSAYAEILKYGLIYDKLFWQSISLKNITKIKLPEIILRCIKIKVNIVKSDFYDENIRRKLNFGHTVSHAIESCFLVKGLYISHGHALVIGLICESFISHKLFAFPEKQLNDIVTCILGLFTYQDLSFLDNMQIIDFIKKDKKNIDQNYNFTLIKSIGSSVVNCSVSEQEILSSLNFYHNLCQV
ncbi:MAG: 3-dehydroquinate synthase [Flavobacteriales bacterium]|nr:3-dehydroquinate synthase [Flavobacteriales bacterium]